MYYIHGSVRVIPTYRVYQLYDTVAVKKVTVFIPCCSIPFRIGSVLDLALILTAYAPYHVLHTVLCIGCLRYEERKAAELSLHFII